MDTIDRILWTGLGFVVGTLALLTLFGWPLGD